MQKFDWDNSLSVGIKVIDEQHKAWVERLNSLSAALQSHQESQYISKTLNFMVDYAEFHFSVEEGLMKAQNYPLFAQHKMEHQKFREVLMDLLVLEMEDDGFAGIIADSINNFQVSWLKNHIRQSDMRFAAFLAEKNVAGCRAE